MSCELILFVIFFSFSICFVNINHTVARPSGYMAYIHNDIMKMIAY
uniref:Uncharacterized protein n=1 Tax=Setaria italica TaxID=4555 RepID=K3ZP89_SETIT